MKGLFKYGLVALFAVAFYGTGFVVPWDLGPNGTVSVAEATHDAAADQGHGDQGAKGGGPPPTVSELPIQYMVSGGVALILVSGGIVYFMRHRHKKPSPEA
ncbi:MAG: hypothetical protein IH886_09625 [Nitrospinae bacterium]|nr:hypothetical protein [Nitrospinota bacterium]